MRKKMLAALHAARRSHALDDDAYRDMLEAQTGQRSAATLTEAQIGAVLDHLNGKSGRSVRAADTVLGAKCRALWVSLYHLGGVQSPDATALDSWVKRQVRVDSLRFVRPADAARLVENLKQWLVRLGVNWHDSIDPRLCVIRAQWRVLSAAGQAPAVSLEEYSGQPLVGEVRCDALIRQLGALVRQSKGLQP